MAGAGDQESSIRQAELAYYWLSQLKPLGESQRHRKVAEVAQLAGSVLAAHELVVALPGVFNYDKDGVVQDPVSDTLTPNRAYPGIIFVRATKPLQLDMSGLRIEPADSEQPNPAYVALADAPDQYRPFGNSDRRFDLLDLSGGVAIETALAVTMPALATFSLPKSPETAASWEYSARVLSSNASSSLEFLSLTHILHAIRAQSDTKPTESLGGIALPAVQLHPEGSPITAPIAYDLNVSDDRTRLWSHLLRRDYDHGASV